MSYDLGLSGKTAKTRLFRDRLVILGLSAGAVVAAIYGTQNIFDKVLFAWTAMGAAFGPLLLWILFCGPVSARLSFTVMATGFLSAVATNTWPQDPARWQGYDKGFLPYVLVVGLLLIFGSKRKARLRAPA